MKQKPRVAPALKLKWSDKVEGIKVTFYLQGVRGTFNQKFMYGYTYQFKRKAVHFLDYMDAKEARKLNFGDLQDELKLEAEKDINARK